MAKKPKQEAPTATETEMESHPVVTSDVLNSLFRSLPPELRLQIYSDVYSNSFEDISTLISMFEGDRPLFHEALDFLSSNHTYELRCKNSIDDNKWLPSSWLPQVLRLSINCGDNSIAKIAISKLPNFQTGIKTKETLRECVSVQYLEIRTTKLPWLDQWPPFIQLLELFPCLNALVITIPKIPYRKGEDPYPWARYDVTEQVERWVKPVSKVMTVEGITVIQAACEGQYHGSYAQIKWKCPPGIPILDLDLTKKRGEERAEREEERKQLMTPEGRREAAIKRDEDSRKRGHGQRVYLEKLTKLARGDQSANSKMQWDLEVAEAERRVCWICKDVFICRSSFFMHLGSIHEYIRFWGCWSYFENEQSRRKHYMYLASREEDDRRDRVAPCTERARMRRGERFWYS